MTATIAVVAFAVSIILAILIHEAAHFGFAKWFGMKVEEFFVGFGPRLWSARRGETEYGVKALPLGGYVKIAGMNPFQPPSPEDLPRTYAGRPPWQRAIVIVAGPATHFVVAFLLFALWLGIVGQPERAVLISGVVERIEGEPAPAAAAGIERGDEVVAVDGTRATSVPQVGEYIDEHVGEPITFTLLRDERRVSVTVTPVLTEVDGIPMARIGVILEPGRMLGIHREGLVGSFTGAGRFVGAGVVQTLEIFPRVFGPEGIARLNDLLFGQAERQVDDPASLVGIARAAGQVGENFGLGALLAMFAGINIFIGVINLLPLPPFDGGHLAVLAVERVRGRSIDARKLIPISAVVLSFFVLFTFAVLYLDIVKPIDLIP
jgi:membrane-associated protease RseP (regulator of RpoE activity)